LGVCKKNQIAVPPSAAGGEETKDVHIAPSQEEATDEPGLIGEEEREPVRIGLVM